MGLTKPRAAQIYNLDYKQSTRVITVANITLSGGAPNSVDGVNLSVNDRVLVIGQNTGNQNGIYRVSILGTGSNGTWVRTSDTNETGEIEAGMIVMVTEGTLYSDTQWKLITDDPITVGTTTLTFVQNYFANSISAGTSNVVVTTNAAVTISSAGTANVVSVGSTIVTVAANINPSANVTYSLGNTTNRWQDLWLSNSSIYLGNVTLAATATQLTVGGVPVVTSTGNAISAAGNITGGNILTAGLISATGNITGNVFIGNGSQLTGIVAAAGAAIINGNSNVSVSANSNVSVAVTSTGVATFATTGLFVTGVVSATGNVTGNYILGNGALLTGVITSVANINSGTSNVTVVSSGGNVTVGVGGTSNVAEFSTLGVRITGIASASGNVTGGNIITAGLITATGNVIGGNIRTAGLITATGNITGGNILLSGNIIDTADLVLTSSAGNANIRLLPTGTGTIIISGNITNSQGNGVGNIGNSTGYFNTVFAKATSAQYADLAEIYVADADYAPGTVLVFGGTHEVTVSTVSHANNVAGVVSTNPSYIMNATQQGKHLATVALQGRVPSRVIGPVSKGDRMVSSHIPGVAQTMDTSCYEPGCIIGKALVSHAPQFDQHGNEIPGTIEIVIGRV